MVRAKAIFTVLVKNGFLEFLEQIDAPSSWVAKIIPIPPQNLTLWQRIRVTCEELGPTFIKLAQVASTRGDLLPAPLTEELKLLRDKVAPMPWESMSRVLNTELRGGIEEHFSVFNTTPVASGSVGQVYDAVLKEEGSRVAVKIQRLGIRRSMRADLEILAWIAQRAHDRFADLRPYALPTIVAELTDGLLQELDFTIEARNASHFNTINPYAEVFAPKVFEPYCTPRLLISEWVEGKPPGNPSIPHAVGVRLAAAGASSVFQQIFLDGFFHADPHSGNLLITPENRLCFIDWGLAGTLTRHMRYMLADLFNAVASQDPERVLQALLASGMKKRIDRARLEVDVGQVLRRYSSLAQSPGEFGAAMMDLLRVFARHGIPLARDYTLLAKAVLEIEESGRLLDPGFDLQKHARLFLKKLEMERWNPFTLAKLTYWEIASNIAQLRELPSTLSRIFQKMEDGQATLTVEHTGLEHFRSTIEVSVNRLVFAVIVAALLMGSSMLVRGEADIWKFPTALGAIGYALAFFFTLYLLWDIVRHGRHKRPNGD